MLSIPSIFKFKGVVSSCFRRWGGHHDSNSVKVGGCIFHAAREEMTQAVKHCCGNVYTVLGNSTTPCQPVPTCIQLTRNGGVQKYLKFSLKTQPLFALNIILSKRRTKSSTALPLVKITVNDFQYSCCELCMVECCKLRAEEVCMQYMRVWMMGHERNGVHMVPMSMSRHCKEKSWGAILDSPACI